MVEFFPGLSCPAFHESTHHDKIFGPWHTKYPSRLKPTNSNSSYVSLLPYMYPLVSSILAILVKTTAMLKKPPAVQVATV